MSQSTDDPQSAELLALSTAHLRANVAAGLDAGTRYEILLAARAAEIAWRDRELAQARAEAMRAIARASGGEDASTAIREGACDANEALHAALLAMTAIATYSTRPDLLSAQERAEVELLKA